MGYATPVRADVKHNLLGQELTPDEYSLWWTYSELKELAGRTDLAPCVTSNVRSALALLWQVVNDLDIEFEQLYEVGV